jgi:ABC-type lipoprotein export system ATPase subunit
VLELLLGLTRSTGHTLLVVTYRSEVAHHADRVLVPEEGRLRPSGERLAW